MTTLRGDSPCSSHQLPAHVLAVADHRLAEVAQHPLRLLERALLGKQAGVFGVADGGAGQAGGHAGVQPGGHVVGVDDPHLVPPDQAHQRGDQEGIDALPPLEHEGGHPQPAQLGPDLPVALQAADEHGEAPPVEGARQVEHQVLRPPGLQRVEHVQHRRPRAGCPGGCRRPPPSPPPPAIRHGAQGTMMLSPGEDDHVLVHPLALAQEIVVDGDALEQAAAHGIAAQDLQVVEVGVAVGLAGDGQRLQHRHVAGGPVDAGLLHVAADGEVVAGHLGHDDRHLGRLALHEGGQLGLDLVADLRGGAPGRPDVPHQRHGEGAVGAHAHLGGQLLVAPHADPQAIAGTHGKLLGTGIGFPAIVVSQVRRRAAAADRGGDTAGEAAPSDAAATATARARRALG